MGFQSPQFDFIDTRFTHRRIKTLEVICSQHVQAVSATPQAIPEPYTGIPVFDPSTGQLKPGNRIVVLNIDAGVSVVPNKVCDVFIVTWAIVSPFGEVLEGPFTTTVSDAVDCPGAGLGRSQTVVQKHDIQVNFCVAPVDTDEDSLFDVFFVTVDIDFCLVVAQEEILKISAARPFCP